MKSKRTAVVLLAVAAAVALTAISAPAQRGGFQVAIAPPSQPLPVMNRPVVVPGFTAAPVAPFTVAPVQPFIMVPGARPMETFRAVAPAPIFYPPVQTQFFTSHQRFHQNVYQNVYPNPYVYQNVYPNTVYPNAVYPSTVVVTVPPPVPQITFGPPVSTPFPAGTPRSQVVAQLGTPSVTIITSTGETLYFTGGVTVIIQNGQVITGPR